MIEKPTDLRVIAKLAACQVDQACEVVIKNFGDLSGNERKEQELDLCRGIIMLASGRGRIHEDDRKNDFLKSWVPILVGKVYVGNDESFLGERNLPSRNTLGCRTMLTALDGLDADELYDDLFGDLESYPRPESSEQWIEKSDVTRQWLLRTIIRVFDIGPIIDRMIRIFENERIAFTRWIIVSELARVKHPKIEALFRRILDVDDVDDDIQRDYRPIRLAAIYGLTIANAKDHCDVLARRLEWLNDDGDEDEDMLYSWDVELFTWGTDPVKSAPGGRGGPSTIERRALIEAIGQLRGVEHAELILKQTENDDRVVCLYAANALSHLVGAQEAARRLASRALLQSDAAVRERIVVGIRLVGSSGAVEWLTAAHDDWSEQELARAEEIVQLIGGQRAFDALFRARKDRLKSAGEQIKRVNDDLRESSVIARSSHDTAFRELVRMSGVVFRTGLLTFLTGAFVFVAFLASTIYFQATGNANGPLGDVDGIIWLVGSLITLGGGATAAVFYRAPLKETRDAADHLVQVQMVSTAFMSQIVQIHALFEREYLQADKVELATMKELLHSTELAVKEAARSIRG